MHDELRPTLEKIDGIEQINLDVYQDILCERFSNTLVADTLMRISHDTSNKFSIQGCPAVSDGLALGLPMKGMAFMVACWAHFIQKCGRAGVVMKDGQSGALEAAMAGHDINALLDMEPVFHELMFAEGWRAEVVGYYDMIKFEGIRQALRKFNASNM
jgi:mannitol-1-phosphate/altronate dehydrogenase